jgi:hypothetical protein
MEYDLSVTIHRPPDAIWAFLTEIQEYIHAPGSPVPEMEKIPGGPTKLGTRWREVVRLAPGVTMTMWSQVTAIEPRRRLEESFRGPWMSGVLRYTIEPRDGGSLLRQRETITPHGPLRLLAPMLDRMLGPRLVTRLQDISRLLEGEAPVEAAVAAPRH